MIVALCVNGKRSVMERRKSTYIGHGIHETAQRAERTGGRRGGGAGGGAG